MASSRLPAEEQEALTFIRSMNRKYVRCRRARFHRFPPEEQQVYEFFNGYYQQGRLQHRATTYTLARQCELCDTIRREVRHKLNGQMLVGPYYYHPEDYSLAGSGIDWRELGTGVFYADLYSQLEAQGERDQAATAAGNVTPLKKTAG